MTGLHGKTSGDSHELTWKCQLTGVNMLLIHIKENGHNKGYPSVDA